MARSRKFFTAGAVGVAALALVAASTSVTGAYFSDTKTGGITGTVGTIEVSTVGSFGSGVNKLDFNFEYLMPGVAQTATIKFKNTGLVAQDVYLTFPNGPALHALNNLGSFGEVHVVDGNNVTWFESTNLNDNRPDASGSCGTFRPTVGTPVGDQLPCWPLPAKQKVASNVSPGGEGMVTFSFNYASKKGNPSTAHPDGSIGGGVFNPFPSPGATGNDIPAVSGNGLPFKVVATQVGQTP